MQKDQEAGRGAPDGRGPMPWHNWHNE